MFQVVGSLVSTYKLDKISILTKFACSKRNLYVGACYRSYNKSHENFYRFRRSKLVNTACYLAATGIFFTSVGYAAAPFYRKICQAYSQDGKLVNPHYDPDKVEKMVPIKDRLVTVQFHADIVSSMQWNFKPQQREITVAPGETALAFYTAMNPSNVPITGISTYSILPVEAAQYFNKIQCFCFEEQQLNPKEQVDMPVFFYIDPKFVEDPRLIYVREVILSYTFFESKSFLN